MHNNNYKDEIEAHTMLSEIGIILKENIRNYAMYIALIIIFILFTFLTDGSFLTARNLTNLANQTGYVAIMAVGMTLVLIVQQIDLSIGYAAGFFGACTAILLSAGVPTLIAIPIILVAGMLAGLIQGLIIGRIGVPAFVTTLAFLFIFRGLLSLVTEASGTIPIKNEFFNKISNGFLPEGFLFAGRHGITLLFIIIALVTITVLQIIERKEMLRYNFKVISKPLFILKIIFFSLFISFFGFSLAGFNGISWTILIVIVVTSIYAFILNKTKFGRYIYATGGNCEAAALAGINVKKTVILTFMSMGLMAALGGILFTSRLRSATPTAGAGFELDAIASCFLGGVSTTGGTGKVLNSVVGAFVIISLTNGLNLMGVGISLQYIIKGIIFISAVAFDVHSQGNKTT